ncbi:FxsA family protein [Arachnia propionica]|uniref:FxsA family protein n=1 Tax=Arachnia propionica TaxID=1750 RepID=A0A3P1WYK4_9ACTN|nr:FxsA family protein [Arachnia propionica]RRD51166.1 FxsA family protein [Arachnia propionica]
MGERQEGIRASTAVLFLIVPVLLFLFAEITVLIMVATQLGWWTLLLIAATTMLGVWLSQREGRRTWQALSRSLVTGSLPAGQTADAVLVLLGGVLLIAPGFLSDVAGLLLLLPFTRPFIRMVLGRLFGRAVARTRPESDVIQGEVVEESEPVTLIPEIEDNDKLN